MPRFFLLLSLAVVSLVVGQATTSQASAFLKPTGSASQALTPKDLAIDTRITGGFAKTTVTTIYANPNRSRIEADFIYTAPEGSVVTGFAYWYQGEKVIARVVEKERAARIYQYITTRMRDPALIEMMGKNTFRARIFPIEAGVPLKIELQLAQVLRTSAQGYVWSHPLKEETLGGPLDNFRLDAQVSGKASSHLGAFQKGHLEVNEIGFTASTDAEITVSQPLRSLRATLSAAREGGSDGFFALLLTPDRRVLRPRLMIRGVQTYDVVQPNLEKLQAGESLFVTGRYRGHGKATLQLNELSVPVEFSNAIEIKNAASRLWATHFIERLSADESKRARVQDLSKRFGVPSKWTSWLAIPQAEWKRYEFELLRTDQEMTAKAYAQAVARDDKAEARRQLKILKGFSERIKALGYGSTQSYIIQSAFSQELALARQAISSARQSGTATGDVKRWERWIVNLEKALDKELNAWKAIPYQVLNDNMSRLAEAYIVELENGRAGKARARKLLADLSRWSETESGQILRAEKGWFLIQQAQERVRELMRELESEKIAKRPNAARQRELSVRLSRVAKTYDIDPQGYLDYAKAAAWRSKMQPVAEALRKEVLAGRLNEPRTGQLLGELQLLEKKSGGHNNWILPNTWYQVLVELDKKEALEVAAGRENGPLVQRLALQRKAIAKYYSEKVMYKVDEAWSKRASVPAAKYVQLARKTDVETVEMAKLKQEIAQLSLKNKTEPDVHIQRAAISQFGSVVSQVLPEINAGRELSPKAQALLMQVNRLRRLNLNLKFYYYSHYYPDNPAWKLEQAWRGKAHETAYQLAQARRRGDETAAESLSQDLARFAKNTTSEAKAFEEMESGRLEKGLPIVTAKEFRSRPGDPLISIRAPRDSAQVIAILPSGEIKRLIWNGMSQQWEARFDIPGHAEEGAYIISIVVVSKDGKRHQLKMKFRVDTTAPSGVGEVQAQNGDWVLSIEAEQGLDHVDAFLPWDERVELKREGNQFTARVVVPEEWRNRPSQVRYVLTDAAHNRTEILVDMSQ